MMDPIEIIGIVIKGAALWMAWQFVRTLRSALQAQPSSDLDRIVDCVGKLHRLSGSMAGSEPPKPRSREDVFAQMD